MSGLPQHRIAYRDFGFIVGGIFVFLAIFFIATDKHPYLVTPFCMIGLLLISIAFVHPLLLKPVYGAWMTLGFVLSLIVGPIVLGLIYYVLFSPIATCKRTFGKNEGWVKYNKQTVSYWQKRNEPYKTDSSKNLF